MHVASATAANHQLLTGQEPRVGFLSFSTHGSAAHDHVTKMQRACKGFRAARPDVLADGELQFDAAYAPDVAARKCPNSPLEGRANVMIFPDLNAGNIAYKIAQRLGGALEFDRGTERITNNEVANQLLVGPPPRKEWEAFYQL